MTAAPFATWRDGDLYLDLRIQPRASRDEIAGQYGDRLRVRLRAPPVDGKANAALIDFLAAEFGVSAAEVKLISGAGGRNKRVRIAGPAKLPASLASILARPGGRG